VVVRHGRTETWLWLWIVAIGFLVVLPCKAFGFLLCKSYQFRSFPFFFAHFNLFTSSFFHVTFCTTLSRSLPFYLYCKRRDAPFSGKTIIGHRYRRICKFSLVCMYVALHFRSHSALRTQYLARVFLALPVVVSCTVVYVSLLFFVDSLSNERSLM